MRMDLIFVLLLALSSCLNSRIFYFIPEHMTWTEAQTYCRLHHTDLATADDQTDHDELLKAVPKGFTDYVWVGLYRTGGTAPWVWSDQSKSVFSLWGIGQPNNYGGVQFCVGASPTQSWNDLDCTFQLASVCYTVKKRTIVRLEVKSSQQMNDPAVKTEILQQLGKILTEKVMTEDAKLSWKTHPDGNVFQEKTYPKKSDVTQQPCLFKTV